MKKTLIALAITFAATQAFAQGAKATQASSGAVSVGGVAIAATVAAVVVAAGSEGGNDSTVPAAAAATGTR